MENTDIVISNLKSIKKNYIDQMRELIEDSDYYDSKYSKEYTDAGLKRLVVRTDLCNKILKLIEDNK